MSATAEDLSKISEFPFVSKIARIHQYTAPLPLPADEKITQEKFSLNKTFSIDYGQSFTQNNMINVPLMHDLGLSGQGVIIAMLDAGFNNLQHEALDHLDIAAIWDFVNGDENVSDEAGQEGNGDHGTFTLSGIGGFHEGQLVGPAYNATYLLAKTENTLSERHVEEDNWVAAAEWADSLGADIISSSLGYRDFDAGEGDYTSADMDGQTAIATIGAEIAASRGILVVNSAGNEGTATPGENTISAPADGFNVLTVGAVRSTGNRAGFSSMGPTADGRFKTGCYGIGRQCFCRNSP